jgi:hypothetical protein
VTGSRVMGAEPSSTCYRRLVINSAVSQYPHQQPIHNFIYSYSPVMELEQNNKEGQRFCSSESDLSHYHLVT